MNQRNNLIATGCAVGLSTLPNLLFDQNRPYTACLVCGVVYQTDEDRQLIATTPMTTSINAYWRRKRWATQHARKHSQEQHQNLFLSGLSMTPEAANLLAAYGIVPFGDMVLNQETEDALLTASAIPTVDAEV